MKKMINLLIWLIEHTSINPTKRTSNKEIVEVYSSEVAVPVNVSKLNFHVGRFLILIYGTDLEKFSSGRIYYNVEVHEAPIKKVEIKDLHEN